MSRSLTRWQAVLLGLVVCSGLVLGIVGLFAIGSRQWPWRDSFELFAGFRQIRGVEVGTRVRVQGIDAGEVVKLDLPTTPGGEARLTLQLDGRLLRNQLLRTDARAQIVSEGLVGGKVIDIEPGTAEAEPLTQGATIATRTSVELAEALERAGQVLQSLEGEKNRVREVVENSTQMLKQGKKTMESIQQVADAVKRAPLVRNYVEDRPKLLYRPNCERHATWLAEAVLFEPGRAQLTTPGRQQLVELVPKLAGLTRHDGAELVVVAYADPTKGEPDLAQVLTQRQSETVLTYLKDQGGIAKKYLVIPAKSTAIGLGMEPPPTPEKDYPAAPAVGILVFVPQA